MLRDPIDSRLKIHAFIHVLFLRSFYATTDYICITVLVFPTKHVIASNEAQYWRN